MESVVPGPTRNGSPLLVVVGVGAQPLSLPYPAHLTAPGGCLSYLSQASRVSASYLF